MTITELAGRKMDSGEIREILQRVCNKYNAVLKGASFRKEDLELIILVEGDSDSKDGVCASMNAILVGYMNPNSLEYLDCSLDIKEACCPNAVITSNTTLYNNLASYQGGEELVK